MESRTLLLDPLSESSGAITLLGLGEVERQLGNPGEARDAYTRARTLFQQVQDRLGEADALVGLGELNAEHERTRARQLFIEAATLYSQLGMKDEQAEALARAAELD